MKLAASLVVRNELGRYLELCVEHLLGFCDTVVVLDDASDDGTTAWLIDHPDERLHVFTSPATHFYVHEGQTRQRLLDLTIEQKPTHVLSMDADEFVSDGAALRARLEAEPNIEVWTLNMHEVWKTDRGGLYSRVDGGWRIHPISCLWRAPIVRDSSWRILDRKLACRRVPTHVMTAAVTRKPSGVDIHHFGWTNQAERQARYDRYVRHDGGKYHSPKHLKSIMFPDANVRLSRHLWPDGPVFDALRDRLAPVEAIA